VVKEEAWERKGAREEVPFVRAILEKIKQA
jgi:hypothetical protein